MTADRCVRVDVDGDPVRVRAAGELTDREREALANLVRAARKKAEGDRAADPAGAAEWDARGVAARRRNHERLHRLGLTACDGGPECAAREAAR